MTIKEIVTDKLYLSLIGVLIIFAVSVAYIFSQVLDVPLTNRPKTVRVEMTSTGGLFEGSSVTYRGVKVGKVNKIQLTKTGIVANIRLTTTENIPVDSVAKVRSLSPVGEQYLDFQPKSTKGPYLKNGSVIPASYTDLPKTLASTVISLNKVMEQINDKQLHTLLVELSTGLSGTGQDVGRMVDQGQVLVNDLQRLWPETNRLLTNGGTVLDIGVDKGADLRQLATSSRKFAAFLRSYDPELRKTLRRAPGQIRTLQALITDAAHVLPGFLTVAVNFSNLFMGYEPHLRATLTNYSAGLGVLAKAISDGKLHASLILQQHIECDYGTAHRDPKNTVRRPLVTTGHCPGNIANHQRGANHAPGPVR